MKITPAELIQKAQELRESSPELIAISMLKQAGFQEAEARKLVAQETLEKAACSALVEKGFDATEAVKLVKAANVDLSTFEAPSEEEALADLLEKAASQIETLESDLAEMSAELDMTKEASFARQEALSNVPDAVTRLTTSGQFTHDDLEAMLNMPSTTLTKVASALDQPWALGKAAGVARQQTDPILEFCLGS